MPCSGWPPWMRSGGVPSSRVSMRAPICASGPVTRRIGRRDSDASPTSTLSNGCAASNPASRRMPVPALPQSSSPSGALRPSTPTPWTMRVDGDGVSKRTPMRAKIAAVARVSSPSRKPSMRDTPSASAANITARCETDLSPGMSSTPCRGWPLLAIQWGWEVMRVSLVVRLPCRADQARARPPRHAPARCRVRGGGAEEARRPPPHAGKKAASDQGTATG